MSKDNNSNLYKGTREVSQEGINGTQKITTKKIYDKDHKFFYLVNFIFNDKCIKKYKGHHVLTAIAKEINR